MSLNNTTSSKRISNQTLEATIHGEPDSVIKKEEQRYPTNHVIPSMGWGPSTNSECGTSISSSSCCEKPKKTMNQTSDPAQLQHHHSIKTTETSPDENDHRSNQTLHHLNSTRNPSRPNQPPGKPRKPKGKQAEEIERQEVAALVGQSNKEWMDIGDRLLTSRGGGVIIVMDGRRRRRRRIRPSGRHRRRWRRLR